MVFTGTCESCQGTGRVTTQPCRTCGGAGLQPRSEVVTVSVPAGVESGDRIAVPGPRSRGRVRGTGGRFVCDGRRRPHPFFRRSGRDLRLTLPLAVHEAALGARVEVPTLGDPVRLKIPAGYTVGPDRCAFGARAFRHRQAATGGRRRLVGGDSSGAAARAGRAIEAALARVRRAEQ
jgi:DnaJ-class molecular chaperone